jgi:tripartite-type tricarboxylate transporter receptor subunit TctC
MKRSVANTLGVLLSFALALGSTQSLGQTAEQDYPNKLIRIIVGFPPGGATDVLTRLVGQRLSEKTGQPVVIENKPGADGIIAAQYAARSAPDGYTLFTGALGQMVFNPLMRAKLSYDPVKDFTPLTILYADPLVIAVNPAVPAHSIQELLALAKANPGKLFGASASTAFYAALENFNGVTGANIVPVPYKGSAAAIMGAVSGDAQMIMMTSGSMAGQLKAGKLRPLAVTGDHRDHALPGVPTLAEAGWPIRGLSWVGLFAPSATPRAIIDKLSAELMTIVKSDYMKEKVTAAGYGTDVLGMSPAEFDAFYKSDYAYWSKVVSDRHLSLK